jgi:hypothetical protein
MPPRFRVSKVNKGTRKKYVLGDLSFGKEKLYMV